MVSEALITNIVTVVVLALLVSTGLMPKKPKYAVNAGILLLMGLIPILYALRVLPFTFGEAGIIKYVVAVVAVYAGQNLISEGIKEEHALRWISVVFGILIILLAVVPSLYQLGALTFTFPEYPPLVNHIMYVLAGLLLITGIFLARD
ncbi:hypothetical protein KY359_01965 [Candidatus Woesearchaeota archaeon]|nr:hypothetical protein [Candidatus Woesearchaeota archaeon]